MKKLLLAPCLLTASLSASENLKIYTYGGGEILQKVFNLVSIICGAKIADYDVAVWIAVNIGLLVAVVLAMTKMNLAPIWKQWLIPVFLTVSLFTLSTEKVIIHDTLIKTDAKQKTYTVDRVPLLLAYTAHFFSSLSHGMTKMIEEGAHIVDDPVYNWTGHIYAGQSLFNTRKMRIIDEVTEENFRNFCSECVFRDLGLGIYTKEELMQAPDLFNFLKERTSKIRGVQYRQPNHSIGPLEGKEEPLPGTLGTLTCHHAISRIHQHLGGQLANAKELLVGSIGSEYQHLIDKSQNAPIQKLIEQQIAIDTLQDYTIGRYDTLAAKRAEQLQISSQKILGAMGANILLASRNYFEALLYGVFPLVIIVSLISLGFKVLLGWIQIIAWVSFWPPCFIIANFVLDSIWEAKKGALGLEKGYSLTMSDGLFNLYNHMEGIACGIFVTIPLLSWGLLYLSKGGASALVHWANSFTARAQGSATVAAGEETTGNYSYQNIGLSSRNFGNVTENQKNLAPLFMGSTTATQDAQGKVITSTPGEGLSLDERKSHLLTDITHSDAFTKSLHAQCREAESLTQGESHTFSQSAAHTANTAQGLNKHLSNTSNTSESWDASKLLSMQRQAQEVFTKAEEYGKTHNIDTTQVFDEALKVGAGWGIGLKAGFDTSLSNRFSEASADQKSERLSDALSIYESMQNLAQTVHREGGTFSAEEGFRDYQDFADSFNQTESSAKQLNTAYSTQKTLENLESDIQSSDLRISEHLNNDFMSYLESNLEDRELIQETLSTPTLRKEAIDGFIQNIKPSQTETPNLKAEYRANTQPYETTSWQDKLETARDQKNLYQKEIQIAPPTQGELFKNGSNTKKLTRIKNEVLGASASQERPLAPEQFEPLYTEAATLKPKTLNEKGEPTEGEFLTRKEEFQKTSSPHFLEKFPKRMAIHSIVRKVGDLLDFPNPDKQKEPYNPGLPGWDDLTPEQQIAVLDARFSDDIP
ncbi:conjugal transfer protein TraG N-terminal domain-containing protein [Candidatus Neptunochlamydia vexilliferae]|uniref:TraG N-terminal Proteobacteria domain-containing protein n=1 Tax=Candidatus Neptunichlamydia vexilliferae TaxID=1651774 RepID=A0ABS0AY59_9BACT|nr:conjugal transfer protein TraG N-terminal domain-containing protein [Candidatus Neptunochlamydia vexilliferae]MBF5059073.1 hypothetical protein [Candidatus Neptunochlamydia vexilliferae]